MPTSPARRPCPAGQHPERGDPSAPARSLGPRARGLAGTWREGPGSSRAHPSRKDGGTSPRGGIAAGGNGACLSRPSSGHKAGRTFRTPPKRREEHAELGLREGLRGPAPSGVGSPRPGVRARELPFQPRGRFTRREYPLRELRGRRSPLGVTPPTRPDYAFEAIGCSTPGLLRLVRAPFRPRCFPSPGAQVEGRRAPRPPPPPPRKRPARMRPRPPPAAPPSRCPR